MPKMKTKGSAKKRLTLTASGRVRRHKAAKRHILTKKRPERKRELGQASIVAKVDERKIKRLIGCG